MRAHAPVSAVQAALEQFPALRDTFLVQEGGKWRVPRINETCCRRPQLAQLLRDGELGATLLSTCALPPACHSWAHLISPSDTSAVASDGPDVLYTGKYAAGLAAEVQAAGGILTEEDLRVASASLKAPLRVQVLGVDVLAAPPPSSAAALLTALSVLAGFDLPLAGAGALGVHRLVEAMKHAFALRMSLGDPGPDAAAPFVPHLAKVLADMQSAEFAEQLR